MESPLDSPMDSPFDSPLESPLESPLPFHNQRERIDVLSGDEEVTSEKFKAPKCPKMKGVKVQIKPNPGNPLKRQRKLTSPIWNDFEINDELDALGRMQCKCKKCGKKYIAESNHGTGNMIRHIKNCNGRQMRDIGQLILQSNTTGSMQCRVPKFDVDEFRELVAIAIARHNLPLQLVEYEGIRSCFAYLYPDVKFFSRHTIRRDILKMYSREKTKLFEVLRRAPGKIALTSDCWTSVTTDGYISLTAHFVDRSWRLQKRILAFTFLPPPHDGASLAEKVVDLLKVWGIEKKVISITLDNASCNDTMVDGLKNDLDLMSNGDYFHIRCCAHILNLIVHEGLKELDEAVLKVRECVKYCKGSQGRKQRFNDCVKHVNLESYRGLRQDVPTRWNSTFLMLDNALFYKKAFVHLQKTDKNFIHCPNHEEWSRVEKICKFLRVFHEVTLAFSGSKYLTSNLYFPNVVKIRFLLQSEMKSSDRFMRTMAEKMFVKFEKYWSQFSTIMGIAVVFDPRYKFQVIDWAYKRIHGESARFELASFKDKLFALFDEYASSSSGNQNNSHPHKSCATNEQSSDSYMEDFDNFDSDLFTTSSKSELQSYLEDVRLPRSDNINVLEYWKSMRGRYPIIAIMARDILAIPISTVASESVFSIGGRVLDAYRSSLKPNIAEALVCLRDWVFQKASMQPEVDDLCKQILSLKVENDNEGDDEIDDEVEKTEPGSPHSQHSGLGD